ncbi:MAG: ankyrin repeat domain-containing protein [Gammaproteobacteria bacterium]
MRDFCVVFSFCLLAACGGGVNLTPDSFTRERADGKIPVSIELIRQEVRAELSGMPEGEAEVLRWQSIEADYHACRLIMRKAKPAVEQVFADCMAQRGYVYMYRHDAEQLHNDIEFEMEKEHDARIAAERKAEEERIAAAQKAEEARLAAEKKRQEENERLLRQEELDGALVMAVRSGDSAEEARLIAQGANPQVAEKEREHIADAKKWVEKRLAAKKQRELDHALVMAVRNGNIAEEALLIAQGANPQVAGRERKRLNDRRQKEEKRRAALRQKELTAALLNAVHSDGYVNIAEVKRLIRGGADVNAKDRHGQTPLYIAAWKGHVQIILPLIKAGAGISAKDKVGNTPLHVAAIFGQTEAIRALIKAGAYIEAKNNNEDTPLGLAAWHGQTEAARALVKAGANIEAKYKWGRTLLHVAAYYGEVKTARVLIAVGANIEAKDKNDYTPLHLAAWQGKAEVARILVRAGAYKFATTNDGETAIQIAERYKQWAVVKILQRL